VNACCLCEDAVVSLFVVFVLLLLLRMAASDAARLDVVLRCQLYAIVADIAPVTAVGTRRLLFAIVESSRS
jgi:hypothetical protein